MAAELLPFSVFQNGGRPTSWILLEIKNDDSPRLRTVGATIRAKLGDNISTGV